MNRKQTLDALANIAERIAKEYNLTIVTSNDITFDLWDNIPNTTPLSEIISKNLEKSGEKFQEIHFTNVPYEEYDLRKDFMVTLDYYFTLPKISVGTQWGNGYTNAVFSGDDNGENYKLSSSQIFDEGGIPLFNKLMDYWNEEKNKIENNLI